jgi:hypothetical protein
MTPDGQVKRILDLVRSGFLVYLGAMRSFEYYLLYASLQLKPENKTLQIQIVLAVAVRDFMMESNL